MEEAQDCAVAGAADGRDHGRAPSSWRGSGRSSLSRGRLARIVRAGRALDLRRNAPSGAHQTHEGVGWQRRAAVATIDAGVPEAHEPSGAQRLRRCCLRVCVPPTRRQFRAADPCVWSSSERMPVRMPLRMPGTHARRGSPPAVGVATRRRGRCASNETATAARLRSRRVLTTSQVIPRTRRQSREIAARSRPVVRGDVLRGNDHAGWVSGCHESRSNGVELPPIGALTAQEHQVFVGCQVEEVGQVGAEAVVGTEALDTAVLARHLVRGDPPRPSSLPSMCPRFATRSGARSATPYTTAG